MLGQATQTGRVGEWGREEGDTGKTQVQWTWRLSWVKDLKRGYLRQQAEKEECAIINWPLDFIWIRAVVQPCITLQCPEFWTNCALSWSLFSWVSPVWMLFHHLWVSSPNFWGHFSDIHPLLKPGSLLSAKALLLITVLYWDINNPNILHYFGIKLLSLV